MTELQKQLSEQFLHLLEEKNLEWEKGMERAAESAI